MSTNNKISNIVSTQLPEFVRNDHPTFIAFMEAYYEYLEQSNTTIGFGKTVDTQKNFRNYLDVDKSPADFLEKIFSEFLLLIPTDTAVNKALLIKKVQDFYKARGTQKALKFLLRILFNLNSTIYLPKQDILRASDGKWFIQKSLRISNVAINSVTTTSQTDIQRFINHLITGSTSGATAIVERTDRFFEGGIQIDELVLSGIDGTFSASETITAEDNGANLSAIVFGDFINSIEVLDGGTLYLVGDPVIIQSNTGSGATAIVSRTTPGDIESITVLNGGAGFKANDNILFSGGGGSGSNAYANTVNTSEYYHPNTYNVIISLISYEANTTLSNAVYSNLNGANINTTIANAMSYLLYGPCGPAETITIRTAGSGYTSAPSIDISANTRIRELGILGRMAIANAGTGYAVNDVIRFSSTRGYGANAKVTAVAGNGAITKVNFVANGPFVIGGFDYDIQALPTTSIVSANGVGANVSVTATLGDGETLSLTTGTLGAITEISVTNRGTLYEDASINLTASGDGTALANAVIIRGIFTYPGRFLNQDGMLSSSKYLQDRDYYQNYSYVVRVRESLEHYIFAVKNMTHPAGLKLFGEYTYEEGANSTTSVGEFEVLSFGSGTYTYDNVANLVIVTSTSHGLSSNTWVYLEFDTGATSNVTNGKYNITSTTANTLNVITRGGPNTSGSVLVGHVITQ